VVGAVPEAAAGGVLAPEGLVDAGTEGDPFEEGARGV